jgi:hypothetical protein
MRMVTAVIDLLYSSTPPTDTYSKEDRTYDNVPLLLTTIVIHDYSVPLWFILDPSKYTTLLSDSVQHLDPFHWESPDMPASDRYEDVIDDPPY